MYTKQKKFKLNFSLYDKMTVAKKNVATTQMENHIFMLYVVVYIL
jgi:hypothetical protein